MASLLRDLIRDYGDDPEKVVALVMAMGADAVDHLLPSLDDPMPRYRIIAAQLLDQLGDTRAVPALIAALRVDGLLGEELRPKLEEKKDRLPSTFGFGGSSTTLNRAMNHALNEMMQESYADVRCAILLALGKLGDTRATDALQFYTTSHNQRVQLAAITALLLLRRTNAKSAEV